MRVDYTKISVGVLFDSIEKHDVWWRKWALVNFVLNSSGERLSFERRKAINSTSV